MRPFFISAFCITFGFLTACTAAWSKALPFHFDELSLIWTAAYDKNEQVYFSTYKNNVWSVPIQISDCKSYVFQATGTIAEDGTIWVVWVQSNKKGNFLYSSTFKKENWSQPKRIITGMDDNRDPVLAIDSSGTPWIAWTAVDDKYSDIFWSRWTGAGWSGALKVHVDNEVPDVNPSLQTNATRDIELSWQTFSDGNPVAVSMQWDGTSWVENSMDFRKRNFVVQKMRSENLPYLPKFIQEPYKANFFYKDNFGAGTIPVIRK